MWFSLLTIVFIFGVTALMYKYSGWWWLVYLLWGWSHVVFHDRLCSLYFILGVQEESKLPLALALLGLDKSISFALRCRLTILPGDNTLGLFLWLKA